MAETEEISPVRAKRFLRSIVKATKRHEARKNEIEMLAEQAEQIKGQKKVKIEKELESFDRKLYEFIAKEKKSLKIDESSKQELSMLKLDAKLDRITEKEAYVIGKLMSKIRHLENELKTTEQARNKEEVENKNEIDLIEKSIFDLRERLKKFMQEKNERDKKVEAIEKKIKEKVGKHHKEITKIEKQLEEMESKYELMKKKGRADKEIEDRICHVKNRLVMARAGMTPEEIGFIPTIKKKEEKKGLFIKKKSIPPGPVPLIKHDMNITPVKDKHVTLREGLPLIPPSEKKVSGKKPAALMPPFPPIKKKRSFFGFIKRLFIKKKSLPPPLIGIEQEEIIF